MKLLNILINENVMLRKQFLDKGKVSESVFNFIISETERFPPNKKNVYRIWLLKRVELGQIQEEDLYKYTEDEGYLDYFENNQEAVGEVSGINNIQQFRTNQAFLDAIFATQEKAREGLSPEGRDVSSGHLSKQQIDRLEEANVSFMGVVDGYQVFEIPKRTLSQEDWIVYKNLLGQINSEARGNGEKNSICTVQSYGYFQTYDVGDMYVFFNTNDPLSPYQFNYVKGEFKDRRNLDIF